MKTSKNGVEMIKAFEGCILHAYDDGFGNLTIGYGHCANDVYNMLTNYKFNEKLVSTLSAIETRLEELEKGENKNENK